MAAVSGPQRHEKPALNDPASKKKMADEVGPKPVLLAGDMPAEMREFTFSKAQEAMEAHKVEKDMAQQLKQALEAKYEGCWHTVIGRSFGCSLANETGFLCFFKIGLTNVVVFRTLDEEAHAQANAPLEGERQEPSHHEEADEDNEGAAGEYDE